MRWSALVLVASLVGCSKEPAAECEDLGDFCHDAGEAGDAEAEACHEFGHDPANDAAACITKRAECEAVCTIADTDSDTE